ncbi:efflux RND transporter periplasmic adaptor subunit [Rhizobacter fulvus]|jgi:RND family efflux transporter MFP subunit
MTASRLLSAALPIALTACLCAAPTGRAQAQTSFPSSAPTSALLACLIVPDRVAELGSPVIGVVDEVLVERGDTVRKGQVLARLRAEVERAASNVVRSRADSEAELRGAIAGHDLAQQKLERTRSLAAQNFVSAQAVEQAEAEQRVAKERMQQAREQLGTSAREVTSAQAQLAQRILRAPFDGVITERYVNPGERVEDKPMLKIAVIGRLKVEVVASTSLFGSLRLGQALSVQPELAGSGPRTARIAQIDRVLEPASNTFRLRLDLPNDDGALPAGLRCKAALAGPPAPAHGAVRSGLELTPASTGPTGARPAPATR